MSRISLALALAGALPCAADPVGPVVVLGAPGAAARADLQAVLLRAVRTEMEKLEVGTLLPTPPLDLDALQLAVGCVGESPGCFEALAAQIRADTLVIVRVADLDAGFELQLERIKGKTGVSAGIERRRAASDRGGAGVLDAVPAAVRALFGFAPLPPPVVALAEGPTWRPFAVGGGGAALLVVAAVMGGLSSSAEADYQTKTSPGAIQSRADVDSALEDLDRAQGRAAAAHVFLALGSALVAGGAVWLGIELMAEPAREETAP